MIGKVPAGVKKGTGLSFNAKPVGEEEVDVDKYLARTEPDGHFHIWASTYLITFSQWLFKSEVIEYYTNMGKMKGMNETVVRVAIEIGTKKIPYEHTHVFIDFKKQFNSKNSRVFDHAFRLLKWPEKFLSDKQEHPNIGPIAKRSHLNYIYRYMGKYDKENLDMLEWITGDSMVEDWWACGSVQEALKMAEKPNEIGPIIQAYSLKPVAIKQIKWKPIYLWQQHLIEFFHKEIAKAKNIIKEAEEKGVSPEMDDRTIYWFYDKPGKIGKSKFAKVVEEEFPDTSFVFNEFGGIAATAQNLLNHQAQGKTCEIVIADFTRTCEDKAIYQPLESIRDGRLVASRYQGGQVLFNNFITLVTANFKPKMNAMSRDRWKIWNREKHEIYFNQRYAKEIDTPMPEWETAEDYRECWINANHHQETIGPKEIKDSFNVFTRQELLDIQSHLNYVLQFKQEDKGVPHSSTT